MTHPEDLLAGYVDGTLSAKERADVDAHLAECATCSREAALAASARSALRSLAEVPAPPDIAARALEGSGAVRRSAGIGGTPRWYRVGGIAAAAAAGLLVLALVLPNIGQGEGAGGEANQGQEGGSARDAGPAMTLAAPPAIEILQINYDSASLTDLTSSYQSDDSSAGAAGAEAAPKFGGQAQTNKALACVVRSAPDESGSLQKLIRARFEGTPAYLAVFLEGPGAEQPADLVTVWVFATKDCRILSFSSATL